MDLPALWREQQHAAFPAGALGLSIDGLPLVKLDATAGATLTASLRSDGIVRPITEVRRAELVRMRELASRALAELPLDGETRAYLGRLVALAEAVLAPGPASPPA